MVVAFQLGGVISRVMAGELDGTQLSLVLATPVLFPANKSKCLWWKKKKKEMLQKTSSMLLLGLLQG